MANIGSLFAQRNVLQRELADLEIKRDIAQRTTPSLVPGLTAQIISKQQELNTVNVQIEQLQNETASAGNLVSDDARGTVPNSRTLNPDPETLILNANGRIESPPDTNSATNALPSVSLANEDTGLNSPVRRTEETQSTSLGNNEQGGPLLLNADVDGREEFDGSPSVSPSVGGRPGAGASSDDAGSAQLTRAEIDAIFNEQKIISQPNVLDQYASYTYQASVYLCNEASYKQLMLSKKKSVDGLQLLFQTGGASQIGRSQYFSNDYYIDKVEIKTKMIGKGTGMSHNATDIQISVVEPYGITLIDNLDRAVQSYLGGEVQKKKNFTAAIYLLAIRFYGYDAQGNLVRGGVGLNTASAVTDRNAFVEKFFPFCLANINFKVASKAVEYQIECKPVPNIIAASSGRGTIPYNIELSGQTLRDLLAGPSVYAAGSAAVSAGSVIAAGGITKDDNGVPLLEADQNLGAPPKADAAPTSKATVRQGLMAAMNEFQAQMVREGQYLIADEYSVEFVNPAIENAKIVKTGLVKKNTPMSTSGNAANQKLGNKQSMDNNSRIMPASAGMQIVQFLDQVIRNSTFMESQQVLKYNEQTQVEEATGTPAKNLAWFKVTMQAEPKGYDYKRNDYAYKVKYILHAYKITNVNSKYYPIPQFNGVHKQYNYWFTGQNTSVLAYEENLNTLYKAVLTGGVNNISSSASELIKYGVDSRSAESAQGAKGKANEPPANLAELLYSPTDLKRCNMTIVGDPAWLQQGEAFAAFPRTQWNFNAFLEDGTINIDSQQPMFEIAFNKPTDYNLSTGLMDPNQQNQSTLDQTAKAGPAQISRIYIASECTSMFDKGKFTQQLQGTLMVIDPARIQQDNEAIGLATGQIALQNFSLNRVLNSGVSSILSSVPFLNNLTTVQSILNQGSALGINLGIGALNNVLGSAPTNVSTPPFAPTSFGLSVGTSTLNTINTGTPTLVIPQRLLNQAVDVGPATPQQLAASDDAGGPELLNREE